MNFLLGIKSIYNDFALLILRIVFGFGMFYAHGLPKIQKYEQLTTSFPDPLGLGSFVSLWLALLAEVVAAILLILGLGTRFVLIPLIITMLVAFFIVHADDPFSKKELALLYLIPFISLFLTGPGKYSLDALIFKTKK